MEPILTKDMTEDLILDNFVLTMIEDLVTEIQEYQEAFSPASNTTHPFAFINIPASSIDKHIPRIYDFPPRLQECKKAA